MSIEITMPALSPTMEEGNLTKWHVKAGDTIEPGQVIAEIETDKATMEVEAVDEGVIEEILVAEGAQGVKVNTPIARLKGEGAAAPAPKQEAKSPAPPAKAEAPKSAAAPARETAATSAKGDRILASPLARRIAEQGGIDLSGLQGSGPNGRIVKADVEAAARAPKSAQAPQQSREVTRPSAPAESRAPAPFKSLESQGIRPGSYDLVPLDMMRKTIAKRMTESFRDVPHFPLTIEIEIDQLLKSRGEINNRFADNGVKISVNDMCIKA
ncbi:MAG TPA: E3 binding domain-containing protein, partial [Terricaulis sp.]|nr:E3 binding domain-containing protein [Terricaulis sp.]